MKCSKITKYQSNIAQPVLLILHNLPCRIIKITIYSSHIPHILPALTEKPSYLSDDLSFQPQNKERYNESSTFLR
ncbi:hypothetical protein HMPREF9418_0468 [Neisseria macacae ATCC 33926]|uniref:Uncharacterized protein n=1 Tax=Neisseria macacae ATCC 33926 TaxID=997348 RepID=A0AA36ULS1_9NEIS|nr:hypothetical protein HMPREF9418_0468 [Neisseria macacae ATCC 33926]